MPHQIKKMFDEGYSSNPTRVSEEQAVQPKGKILMEPLQDKFAHPCSTKPRAFTLPPLSASFFVISGMTTARLADLELG